jgi:hypothetical protein
MLGRSKVILSTREIGVSYLVWQTKVGRVFFVVLVVSFVRDTGYEVATLVEVPRKLENFSPSLLFTRSPFRMV